MEHEHRYYPNSRKKSEICIICGYNPKTGKIDWEKRFDELIGRPVSGETIKNFIRDLLKQNEPSNQTSTQNNPKED